MTGHRSFRRWASIVAALMLSMAAGAAQPARETTVEFDGKPVLPMHGTVAGFWFFAQDEGVQLAMMGHPARRAVASLAQGRRMTIRVPCEPSASPADVVLQVVHLDGDAAEVNLRLASAPCATGTIKGPGRSSARLVLPDVSAKEVLIDVAAPRGGTAVRLEGMGRIASGRSSLLAWIPRQREYPQSDAVASSPSLRPAIEQAMIEWDWRMQDGIETPRASRSYAQAIAKTLSRGTLLLDDLGAKEVALEKQRREWQAIASRPAAYEKDKGTTAEAWESLWLAAHRVRRELALTNPLADVGPLVFVKHVPSTMSHQLTQYYGYEARPGGGVFLLVEPGRSMRVRQLATSLPDGNYLHPHVSYDGDRIWFAFCERTRSPVERRDSESFEHHYHLYRMNRDGTHVERLTDGPYDDFAPVELPDGHLLFISTRRGGFHRCGRGPCYVYTLALANADGSDPHSISFHETNEWDPAVLHDGRVIYTRWDYVDRNAVFYQQLWSVRQDGSDVRIYFGNNTFNPTGTWEARPIPGSNKVMATAAPHHGMTAGSIILIDVTQGVDGLAPITRLTPDALFPESEIGLAHGTRTDKAIGFDDPVTKTWGPQPQARATRRNEVPEEEVRWPGHCYRSP